ncbi:sulfatase-like hydrolase/transferase [Candidatus Uhrbacteria bacterium]|nr:sulfatase-like hydrolase/transferase [Candidatus Uhrbacteria bacterium]
MKILIIFIDMLRPEMLHVVNRTREKGSLDEEFEKIGGTLYRNCFTPAPDTARSLACVWSGKYPYKNGCDKRIKYPGFFLKNDGKNILEILLEHGFNLSFFNNPNEKRNGVFPPGFNSRGVHNTDLNLEKFLQGLDIKDKSLVYISLADFHYAMDDFDYYPRFVKKGHQKVANSLRILRRDLNVDDFDHLLIFSDHGFKLRREFKKEPAYLLLNKARTNTFLLHRKKADRGLVVSERFSSVMDIYPTLCEIIGAPVAENIDGISLFSEKERPYLIAEEHTDFAPRVNQTINIWAVIKKNGIYYRTLDAHYFENHAAFTESPKELDLIIADHSPFFKEYVKEKQTLEYYRTMVLEKSVYTDGSRRVFWPSKMKRTAKKILGFFGF